jgi:hypothetical protein
MGGGGERGMSKILFEKRNIFRTGSRQFGKVNRSTHKMHVAILDAAVSKQNVA